MLLYLVCSPVVLLVAVLAIPEPNPEDLHIHLHGFDKVVSDAGEGGGEKGESTKMKISGEMEGIDSITTKFESDEKRKKGGTGESAPNRESQVFMTKISGDNVGKGMDPVKRIKKRGSAISGSNTGSQILPTVEGDVLISKISENKVGVATVTPTLQKNDKAEFAIAKNSENGGTKISGASTESKYPQTVKEDNLKGKISENKIAKDKHPHTAPNSENTQPVSVKRSEKVEAGGSESEVQDSPITATISQEKPNKTIKPPLKT